MVVSHVYLTRALYIVSIHIYVFCSFSLLSSSSNQSTLSISLYFVSQQIVSRSLIAKMLVYLAGGGASHGEKAGLIS